MCFSLHCLDLLCRLQIARMDAELSKNKNLKYEALVKERSEGGEMTGGIHSVLNDGFCGKTTVTLKT